LDLLDPENQQAQVEKEKGEAALASPFSLLAVLVT
jgi:hypothetical protein